MRFWHCFFSHTLLLWAFVPYKKKKKKSGNLNSTKRHQCSLSPIIFCYNLMHPPLCNQTMNYFSQSIRNMFNMSFFDLFSSSELKRHVHFAGAMVLSSIKFLQLWYTCNCNNDDFNPQFDFYRSGTSNLCFIMQEDILVSQMCLRRNFLKLK